MKTDIIIILTKRAEYFEKIHHAYEAREVRSAIDTIERLLPPELFNTPNVITKPFVCDSEDKGGDRCETQCLGCDGFQRAEAV